MRSAFALTTLVLLLAGCSAPVYSDPPLVAKVDRQRIERDNCLLARAPQLDDHSNDVRGVARRVAAACADETARLLALSVPYADDQARLGFQQEAERRAADIVLTFRRVDGRAPVGTPPGAPTPLSN
jgi:hypothetical protein